MLLVTGTPLIERSETQTVQFKHWSGSDDESGAARPSKLRRLQSNLLHRGSSKTVMPVASPLSISLENDTVVLRSSHSADEGTSAVLKGNVTLKLVDSLAIKAITLGFHGRGRTHFTENTTPYKSHSLDESIFAQEISLLETSGGLPNHVHTLGPGEHEFSFSFDLPPELPASLHASSGSIEYRLKAVVVRPGFTAQNYIAKRPIFIHHGLRADAIEYSSSLDIENDWPGKVSYAFTIPSKAHAVGTSIPIHVKFVPHTKGVKISSLTTTIRESITLYSRHHSANTSRDVVVVRHDMTGCPGDASPGAQPVDYRPPTGNQPQNIASPPNGLSSDTSSGFASPRMQTSGLDSVHPGELHRRLASVSQDGRAGESSRAGAAREDEMTSTDINTIIRIPVPANAPPSHSRTPIVITHRIKWSALILNPDGHTSELRCALPLHLLASDLGEEARLAASGATNLLFGPSGVLMPTSEDAAQVQLPSYQEHVHDRIANASAASYFPNVGALVPTAWSASARSSPAHTPLHTPSPSRPASPVLGPSDPPRQNASSASLSALGRGERINWADEELRGTLTPASSPPAVAAGQHPHQDPQATGRPRRAGSQASTGENSPAHPSGRFHGLHIPKPLRSFTNLSLSSINHRSASSSALGSPTTVHPHHSQPVSLPAVSAALMAQDAQTEEDDVLTMATPRRRNEAPLPTTTHPEPVHDGAPPSDEPSDLGLDVLNQVPTYEVAERWLGGGVVPLETQRGLPDYETPPPSNSVQQ